MTWERVKLGEIALMFNGGTPDRSNGAYYMGEIPWITSADLQNGEIQAVRFYITEKAVADSATRIIPKNSLLLVTRTGVGKIAIAPFDICISQDFTGIIPDKSRVDLKYLLHFLRSSQNYFTDRARGATIQGVTRAVVNGLEIPLPPLAIQQRIAAVLDEVDALRQKRGQSIKYMDILILSHYRDLAKHTRAFISIGELGIISTGSTPLKSESISDLPFVTPGDMAKSRVYSGREYVNDMISSKVRIAQPFDVLVVCIGATLGKMSIAGAKIAFNQQINSICFGEEINPIFGFYALQEAKDKLVSMSSSTTLPIVNKSQFSKLPIRVVSREVQDVFARFSEEAAHQKEVMEKELAMFQHLYSSLQARAFAGELELRELAPV